jgi:hypothetical protein
MLYRGYTYKCSNERCSRDITRDIEDDSSVPCSDECWLQIGLQELLDERAAAIPSHDLHDIVLTVVDRYVMKP